MNHEILGHDGYEPRDITGLVRLVASGQLDLSRSVSQWWHWKTSLEAWTAYARRRATRCVSSSSRSDEDVCFVQSS
jgi:hypothetical protein